MNRHERIYRRLLILYPGRFRERYEEEMATLFTDQLRDARASGSGLQTVALWLRSLGDLIATAPGQYITKEALMPRPVDPSAATSVHESMRPGLGTIGLALALLPFWVGILLWLLAPAFMSPMFDNPPEIFGLPQGIVMLFIAGLLMAFGVVAIRSARTQTGRTAAFVLLTIPSLVLVLVSPAIITTMENSPV